MGAAQPPSSVGDNGDVAADQTHHGRSLKNQELGRMGDSLASNGGDRDAQTTALSRITRARLVLAFGLALEVSSTFWAFQQAKSAGALDGVADCSIDGRFAELYTSSRVMDECDGPIDADAFYAFTETLDESWHTSSYLEEHAVCDSLTYPAAGEVSFKDRCVCDFDYQAHTFAPCSWVALSRLSGDTCYAQSVSVNNSDGAITGVVDLFFLDSCCPTHSRGTVELTITALVVALSSQLVESFVGFKFWKGFDRRTNTAPTLAASIFEAFGVVVVSSVLLTLPRFYDTHHDTTVQIPAFFWSSCTIVAIVVIGSMAEITAECSDRVATQLPYLGAVGNGLIWLGAAMIEVLVTLYLLVTGTGVNDLAYAAREVAGLFAVELLGLVSMWIARGLWTRAKLLRASVKINEWPMKKSVISSRTHFK